MISGVVCNTALAQIPSGTGVAVKIETPVDSTNLPAGDLTIYGTSSDDDATNCQVYADWNDLKPMQNVSANGPKGISDFSKWSFTYTSNYHNIVQGQNELTSKITCYDSAQNATSKSYSINVTGTEAVSKNSNDTLQQTNKENISNTDSEATNVDTDTESTNVDTAVESTNILPVKSNNTDSTPRQNNEDTDNEANNILPVENNKSNSGTYKILPLYSESNEKSTKSSSSEGSDGTNLGSTGTFESEDGYNSKAIDKTNTGTFTTFGSQQEGQIETNTSPMSGSKISEGTDQSGVDSNTNTYFTYEPDLGQDQESSNNYDQTIHTPGSDNSISNLNDEGNSIFGLKFNHPHKSIDNKLEQKIEKLEDKIVDRVHLFDLIG